MTFSLVSDFFCILLIHRVLVIFFRSVHMRLQQELNILYHLACSYWHLLLCLLDSWRPGLYSLLVMLFEHQFLFWGDSIPRSIDFDSLIIAVFMYQMYFIFRIVQISLLSRFILSIIVHSYDLVLLFFIEYFAFVGNAMSVPVFYISSDYDISYCCVVLIYMFLVYFPFKCSIYISDICFCVENIFSYVN